MEIERLDHLGIVAGIGREIGLVDYFNELDTQDHERVSLGQAVLAMILNGLGFSNRQLYLVPQFFATKPVAHLLGAGIMAEDLNDDRLGRTLDWLTAHDLTALFAGLVRQARQAFAFPLETAHVDTTSFSVSGEYTTTDTLPDDSQLIRITYGYSRDHRQDLQQWMLALATAGGSDVPIGLQLLAGNASDKESLLQQTREVLHQLGNDTAPIFVADSGLYSAANMRELTEAQVRWIARVPETSHAAKEAVRQEPEDGQGTAQRQWWETSAPNEDQEERWIVARSQEGVTRCRKTMVRQAERDRLAVATALRKLPTFACEADAQTALTTLRHTTPPWITIEGQVVAIAHYPSPGRPAKGASPELVHWEIAATSVVSDAVVEREALRRAWFIVATNVRDLPAEEILRRYAEQSSVERGFAFLKDPLFLASSVFVKKPERVMAIGFIMVCCLLVYRLAEYRVREQLAHREETIPDQVHKPSKRPTMRWIFQCFEGIHLVVADDIPWVVGLNDFHRHILALLGPLYQQCYLVSS